MPKTAKHKDTVVLIKEGDLAGLKFLTDSILPSECEVSRWKWLYIIALCCIPQSSCHHQYLLDSGMGTNQIDIDENTPVHLAIKNDDTEAMKCLLDHKRYWHYYCKQ